MKLRTKILLLLVPPVIVPLLVLGWVAYGELRAVSETKLFDEMRSSLDHLSAHLEEELKTATANISLFSKNTLVKKYVLTTDQEDRYTLLQSPLLRVFGSFQEAYPDYYEIRILLPDGYEDVRRTTTDIDNQTEEEGDNPLFRAMTEDDDAVFSAVARNPDNGRFSLYVGTPMILRDPSVDPIGVPPTLRGYLMITVGLGELDAHVADGRIGATGYLLALDAEGNEVFQSAAGRTSKRYPASFLPLLADRSPARNPLRSDAFGETAYISAAEPLPGLYLIAALPQGELHSIVARLGLAVAGITLLTVLLTSTCLYLVLQRLVIEPIQRLRLLSKDIGRGKLDIRSSLASQDEIGELGKAFEDMAGNLQRSNEKIRYVAYHDSLTGLPNRAMFREYLNRVIAHSKRSGKQFALLFLDIDDFKRVNDTLGHQAGDRLLEEVTDRLSKCLRRADYVTRVEGLDEPDEILARLGGDEFIVLLPDILDAHTPGVLANRLLKALTGPIPLEGSEVYIGASIGITLYPSDGDDADDLIKNADIAMYHAKEGGKNDYRYYLDSMNQLAHERLIIENKLRKALANNELSLYYQPQVDARTHEVVALEALLRWRHPEDGMIPPDVFIPVAEQAGLIVEVGEWVIQEACRQNRAWQKAGLPQLTVSVNVSSIQFARQNVPELIATALRTTRLDPRHFEIEITESAMMSQPERAIRDLSLIKSLGVRIALDDFGTGYSSFSYLHRFPIDTLKIDRSFIQGIGDNGDHTEIVAAIIAMAHTLKLRVVAEGIETQQQSATLLDKDCDLIQGFLFSKPLPAADIPALLRKRKLKLKSA